MTKTCSEDTVPIRELAVEIPNQVGQLARIAEILAAAGVNMLGLAASSDGRTGWVRLTVDNAQSAEAALQSAGHDVEAQDALGLLLNNSPGTLCRALKTLQENNINIDYIYNCVHSVNGQVLTIIGVQQPTKAGEILTKAGFQVADSV
jgi:hypothetical protein